MRDGSQMTKIFITAHNGETTEYDAQKGLSLMEAIKASGSDEVAAICGGVCSCATCHVYVDAAFYDQLPGLSTDELDLVSETEHYREGASRLSCQIKLTDALEGLKVTIAPEE